MTRGLSLLGFLIAILGVSPSKGSLEWQGVIGTPDSIAYLSRITSTDTLPVLKDTLLPLANKPTPQELSMLFFKSGVGLVDPFVALPRVIQKGDSAIVGLSGILATDSLMIQPVSSSDSAMIKKFLTIPDPDPRFLNGTSPVHHDSAGERRLRQTALHKIRLYSVMVLEALGGKAAYTTLFQTVQTTADPDLKGIALNALSTSYHSGEYLQCFHPDKGIVHLLLENVDDTTILPYFQTTMGLVARQGLIAWFGMDTGDPLGTARRLLSAQGSDRGSLADYREQWWQLNQAAIAWDSGSLKFSRK